MPVAQKLYCPECRQRMARRPAGRCPHCGADVRDHVQARRQRESAIEKVVAVVATLLVVGLSLFAGGCTIFEGALVYAVVGLIVWCWGRQTF